MTVDIDLEYRHKLALDLEVCVGNDPLSDFEGACPNLSPINVRISNLQQHDMTYIAILGVR